jgi:hypothetical protein
MGNMASQMRCVNDVFQTVPLYCQNLPRGSVDDGSDAAYGCLVSPSFELRNTFIKMNSRLDNVHERLEAALARIDIALTQPAADDGLAGKLKILTDEHQALRGQHSEISRRLDAAISHLQRVLKD